MKKLISVLVLAWMGICATQAAKSYDNPDTIVVAQDGSGEFQTISEAVEVCRAFMEYHKVIYIKKGVYCEKLVIPSWLTNIELCGEDAETTILTHNDHANMVYPNTKMKLSTFRTYTLKVEGSDITIKNVSYENLGIIPNMFSRLGISIERCGDDIHIPAHQHYEVQSFMDGSTMAIADAPWPGLTPDLLSIILVVATQANGTVLIHQKMFESRLFFVDKLIDMGAQIILCDPHRAVVVGHNHKFKLRGARMSSPDIRAGIALLIAAMSAEGVSTISNIEQIDRGYEDIEKRLTNLGASIKRIP